MEEPHATLFFFNKSSETKSWHVPLSRLSLQTKAQKQAEIRQNYQIAALWLEHLEPER